MNSAPTQLRQVASRRRSHSFTRGHLGGPETTEKGSTMTKDIYFIGSCAFIVAVMVFVWSLDLAVSSRANTASTSGQAAAVATEAAPLPATPSYKTPLPVQEWDAF
jgi:hypothetical protein